MPIQRVPTVTDLRVKLCYICREEEHYDNPPDPPRLWTHACRCTLVAHESCLLRWIRTAQQDPDRARNALKCPQCGDSYELISKNPPTLRLLDAWNRTLSRVGKIVTVSFVGTVILCFGSGVYFICTSYGAFALREFIGQEMFDALLTDDPKSWPWHAFLNLPFIPLSLIVSRTALWNNGSPLIPLLLAWPSSTPVATARAGLSSLALLTERPPRWPPSPTLVCVLFPLVRALYKSGMARLTHWLMRTREAPAAPVRAYEWAMGEDQPGFRIQVNAQVADDGAPADAGAAAQRTIRITGASVGRLIGGALVMPTIARVMGQLLLRVSRGLPLLRLILAPKPQKTLPRWWGNAALPVVIPEDRSLFQNAGLVLRLLLNGNKVWIESDPVWWRNAVGLGVFLVVKDFVKLAHIRLAKQELESRHVKNKSFAGVDLEELDLIPPL
ncbi:hypothetical protein BV25DRAFT_1888964 [Artomyces pyxidatus]|uniref:Uncharacterized protein n=1 Tax=Artomyces pyxidatus TaxID=48021 RepID=A0ACB8SVJ4_9AGAM|nr:hypothetical protein BV25DRAFT_1888964 [Artomyces pyxidatus]